MRSGLPFSPGPSLLAGKALKSCRAVVILPARNEEASLPETLDALLAQTAEDGRPLGTELFEVLLLLNNCVDDSVGVAEHWLKQHPAFPLRLLEIQLAPEQANAGTARRLLMDTAWHRLQDASDGMSCILSTDADTLVAPDWICQTLRAMERGVDAVGGVIRLRPGHLERLPPGVRRCYLLDRRYQQLVARYEDLLDPQTGDPWPRHLEHFGASLACSREAYARAGGLPSVAVLEDVAFVDALRRCDARIRHDVAVVVYTSSRMDGRTPLGLSGQLRCWQSMGDDRTRHLVDSAAWLTHRFRSLRRLRHCFLDDGAAADATLRRWTDRIRTARGNVRSVGEFLAEIDADRIIAESFEGGRRSEIEAANRDLLTAIGKGQEKMPVLVPADGETRVHFRRAVSLVE